MLTHEQVLRLCDEYFVDELRLKPANFREISRGEVKVEDDNKELTMVIRGAKAEALPEEMKARLASLSN